MHKQIKRIGISASILTLLMGGVAIAGEKAMNEVKFTIGKPQYTIGDTVKDIDTIPYIKDGRTMLPVRYVAEIVGLEEKDIEWNPAKKTVTIFKGNSIIQMTVGSNVMIIDGQKTVMDTAPEIQGGRTMLPVGHIAKALDIEMKWDSIEKTISVFTENKMKETEKQTTVTWDYNYDQLLEKALKSSKNLKKMEMLVEKAEELKDDAVDKFKKTNSIPKGMINQAPAEDKIEFWDNKNLVYRNLRGQQVALEKAEKDVEVMKEEIAYNVRTAYDELLKAYKDQKLAEQALELKRDLMNHTKLRYNQKMVSEIENNKAKRDYEEAKKNYEMSVKALDSAYEKLNYLVGLNPEERYTVNDQIEFTQIPEVDLNLDSHIPTMIHKSPQIWALEQKAELGQLGLDLFVFNVDGDYEATKIDVATTKIDLANLKEAYEENLRKLHTALQVLQKQYESTMIAYEKAQDDLKVAKLNVAVGNGIPVEVKGAKLKVEELKNKLDGIMMDYNEKATLYQKPWLALK